MERAEAILKRHSRIVHDQDYIRDNKLRRVIGEDPPEYKPSWATSIFVCPYSSLYKVYDISGENSYKYSLHVATNILTVLDDIEEIKIEYYK